MVINVIFYNIYYKIETKISLNIDFNTKHTMASLSATPTDLPAVVYCPITHEVMEDPWVDNSGISYEKTAIIAWLNIGNNTSPVSRQPLELSDLRPNLALRAVIEKLTLPPSQRSESKTPVPVPRRAPEINPDLAVFTKDNLLKVQVLYTDKSLGFSRRMPTDLILNVDLSYSMDTAASKKDDVEAQMFSILALVKHSMKTIIKGLNQNDHLGIISFANSSKVELPLIQMTEENKTKALLCVERLRTCGSTNFWSGIKESFDHFKNASKKLQNPTILTFTDGQSNIDPASGLMPTLKRFNDQNNLKPVMNVFGFGPELDTDLLFKTSKLFGGRFDFISDFSMVGTVFVNALTNILMTPQSRTFICIPGNPLNPIKKVYGEYERFDNEIQIDSKAIMYGQPREFIVEFEKPVVDYQNSEVRQALLLTRDENDDVEKLVASSITLMEDADEVYQTLARVKLEEALESTWSSYNEEERSKIIMDFIDYIKTAEEMSTFKSTPMADSMLTDLSDQLLLATQDKYYREWGRKYIYAYWSALRFQQCNNFKDQLLSHFGSNASRNLLQKIEEIYMTIPPPKTRTRQAVSRAQFVTTSYNASGGCVYGETLVTCLSEERKTINIKVSDVKPDMLLLTRNTETNELEFSQVELMTIMPYHGNLVWYENDIALTPWHPVRNAYESGYVFPQLDSRKADAQNPKRFGHWNPVTPEVFDFIMENRGDLVLGDMNLNEMEKIMMITLGHGITKDPVAFHKYLGNNRVVEDLYKYSRTLGGKRILTISKIIRNTNACSDPNQIARFLCE